MITTPVADGACAGACLHAAPEHHLGSPPRVQLLWACQLPNLLRNGASQQAGHQQCWDLYEEMPKSAEVSKAHRFAVQGTLIMDSTACPASSRAQQHCQVGSSSAADAVSKHNQATAMSVWAAVQHVVNVQGAMQSGTSNHSSS